VYWDPFDRDIARDPYPVYRRMRAEAPLYYNDRHDFYALSLWDDIDRGLRDWTTLSSSRAVGDFFNSLLDDCRCPEAEIG